MSSWYFGGSLVFEEACARIRSAAVLERERVRLGRTGYQSVKGCGVSAAGADAVVSHQRVHRIRE